ncbi:Periplasmic aromatic aldehyde oxidoreductase, FAD binding protein subunit YagS [Rubellimicrobium mesophilum DSM 19309]|uniref:Periplasmic aromatic aldehyde oxidoreductase, FAD binding protein subunit YagS n=2 Tax=Rubellimicrobium TaxID=295418 RepID=A0A017HIH4_9RHOB|nr:Periplasmic aromatic aldehyde oxidoreductase, FAD binding protein subunit YagS [Rubellimicrobium mesophilum DSM 19309]
MATLAGNVLQRTRCHYFRDRQCAACNKRETGSGCAVLECRNRRLAVLGTSERCIANYSGDFAIALVTLRAEVTVRGTDGSERTLPFENLHRPSGDAPHIETTLAPGDLITGCRPGRGPAARPT